jgi:hypothetical protein
MQNSSGMSLFSACRHHVPVASKNANRNFRMMQISWNGLPGTFWVGYHIVIHTPLSSVYEASG